MKPYFAKYLPVEGAIKEKEFGLTPDNKILPYHEITLNSIIKTKDCKRLKLFLCSRYIQVGDEVKDEKGWGYRVSGFNSIKVFKDKYFKPCILSPDIKDHELNPLVENCYKIIGEISPEATWVEEGMEFHEYEIMLYLADLRHPDESILNGLESHKKWLEWANKKIKEKPHRYAIVAEVKGPCGHFH